MAEDDEALHTAVGRELRMLTQGLGVQRSNLVKLFQTGLRELAAYWKLDLYKPLEDVREDVKEKLRSHIDHLEPRPANQDNFGATRLEQYRFIISVGFNIADEPTLSAVQSLALMERHDWIEHQAPSQYRMDARTSQRELKHAIAKIERQILDADSEHGESPVHLDSDTVHRSEGVQSTESDPIYLHPNTVKGNELPPARLSEIDRPAQGTAQRGIFAESIFKSKRQNFLHGYVRRRALHDRLDYVLRTFGVANVYGHRGIGKSDLLLGYVLDNIEPQEKYIHLDASGAKLESDITHALHVNGQQTYGAMAALEFQFAELLSSERAPKYVIIDNAVSEEQIRNLIPSNMAECKSKVLIASNSKLGLISDVTVEVDTMTESEACELVRRSVGWLPQNETKRLTRSLGNHPLGLIAACHLMRTNRGITVDDMRSLLRVDAGLIFGSKARERDANLVAIYAESLEHIRTDSSYAVLVLAVLVFLDMETIPALDFIAKCVWMHIGIDKLSGNVVYALCARALSMLRDYGLVHERDRGKHTIHALTRMLLIQLVPEQQEIATSVCAVVRHEQASLSDYVLFIAVEGINDGEYRGRDIYDAIGYVRYLYAQTAKALERLSLEIYTDFTKDNFLSMNLYSRVRENSGIDDWAEVENLEDRIIYNLRWDRQSTRYRDIGVDVDGTPYDENDAAWYG